MPRIGVALLLVLSGCRFDPAGLRPLDAARDLPDAAAVDRALPEHSVESATDLPPVDAAPDAAQDGVAPDSALPDAATPDAALPDTGVDPLTPFGAPQPLTVLNSPLSEDDPTLTGDMLEIYFDRGGDLWTASRLSTAAPWGPPLPVIALNSLSGETTPSITPDGLTIFFASNRPGGPGDHDIYVSTRTQRLAGWSPPQLVSSLSTSSKDNGPAPHAALLEIVLASNRPGSASDDLYHATRASLAAAWATPVNLAALNSSDAEGDPWLGSTVLYFTSTRPGKGGWDIYLSQRSGTSFATPVAVDSLNSSSNDGDPWLSPDLRTVVFSSDRGGTWDIYVATR